jgi:hypothetical protein
MQSTAWAGQQFAMKQHHDLLPNLGRQSADAGDVEDPDDLGGIIGVEGA